MPELPDLEVFKGNIFTRLTSKRLAGLEVFNHNKMTYPQELLAGALAGRELLNIGRVGKELLFDFGGGRILSAHLMLSGRIAVVDDGAVQAIKHKIFSLRFERETVVFSDVGGLCTIKYNPPMGKAPDAFDAAFTLHYFLKLARRKGAVNIKAFIIDQKVVKGIGNAYADEILWAARISPHCLAGNVPEDRLEALHRAVGQVLHDAVESLRRLTPDAISGEERSFLKVHNKALKVTETGYPILTGKIASKTTYYTDEQVFYA